MGKPRACLPAHGLSPPAHARGQSSGVGGCKVPREGLVSTAYPRCVETIEAVVKSSVWRCIGVGRRAVELPRLFTKRFLMNAPFGELLVVALMKRRLRSGKSPKLSSPAEISPFYDRAIAEFKADGIDHINYFEAGVYAGSSLAEWSSRCDEAGVATKMYGADSFAGLPDSTADDDSSWLPGEFYCPIDVTRWNLDRLGVPRGSVRLIKGWFDDTLTPELAADVGSVEVAMLDADTYASTVPVLDFLTPLLGDRAWLIFDDWYSGGNLAVDGETLGQGVEQAFAEWRQGAGQRWDVEVIGDYELEYKAQKRRLAGHVVCLQANAP